MLGSPRCAPPLRRPLEPPVRSTGASSRARRRWAMYGNYVSPSHGNGVKVLRRVDTKGSLDDLDLPCGRYGFGASWHCLQGRNVDVDLQCVVVNDAGTIIDCAYYNNLKAAHAITHSGDEFSGKKTDNIDEIVWVNLQRLGSEVSLLVFVVAAYSGGSLADVSDGRLHVLEERESNEVALFEMERSSASVDVVAAMYRGPGGLWRLRIIDEPAQEGKHFMDILDHLACVIRGFLPSAPRRQKVAFAMEKGSVLDLPQDLNEITVGLGWDVDAGEVDLDVSALLMDAAGSVVEAIFFGRLESDEHGVRHSGDNLTGEGEGDDEQIQVSLNSVGADVLQIFFVVNIYTKGKTFSQVASPYCRVVDRTSNSELCRYLLREAGDDKGLIIAKIAREASDRWGFHALGLPCAGATYKESLPLVRSCFHLKTAAIRSSVASSHAAPAPTSRGCAVM